MLSRVVHESASEPVESTHHVDGRATAVKVFIVPTAVTEEIVFPVAAVDPQEKESEVTVGPSVVIAPVSPFTQASCSPSASPMLSNLIARAILDADG